MINDKIKVMKNEFEKFKNECVEMIIECFDEDFNDCKMAQEVSKSNTFSKLAKVMIAWEFWEMEDAIEKAEWFK
jgi:hypothetical protein